MTSKQKGDVTELEIITYITKLGYTVSVPFGDRSRYDQIWDINGKLLKIQVKTALVKNNTIEVSCGSINRNNGNWVRHTYNDKEIDGIATFYEGNCYFIPISAMNKASFKLRIKETKNNQSAGINWLYDYKVEKILGD